MRDLYKQLHLARGASDDEIRARLPAAAPEVREAAEMILLDPRRRPVYDRNHDLLSTIAQLRLELGLNYTRFWSRREFKEFWRAPVFVDAAPAPQARPGRRVDKMMIAQAFHTARRVHHHGRHHVARWGWLWMLIGSIVTVIVTIAVLWHLSY